MQIPYTIKNTSANTDYLAIQKALYDKAMNQIICGVMYINENHSDPNSRFFSDFFCGLPNWPKRNTGNDRSKGTGFNSRISYMSGIVNNHNFVPNAIKGSLTRDLTKQNIKWITEFTQAINAIDPTFEVVTFVDTGKPQIQRVDSELFTDTL